MVQLNLVPDGIQMWLNFFTMFDPDRLYILLNDLLHEVETLGATFLLVLLEDVLEVCSDSLLGIC